jgi:hypothetical protein
MTTLYRLLTCEDSSAFCHKVSEAMSRGWQLHGSPSCVWDHANGVMRCAQAVTKDVDVPYDPEMRLGRQ